MHIRRIVQTSLAAIGVALLASGSVNAQIRKAVDSHLATKSLANTGTEKSAKEITTATGPAPKFNIKAQTACETELLNDIGAHEIFSGKAYEALTEIAPAYGREMPHVYVFPKSWNMAYIAASAAVDGRGKIVVGQQADELFNPIALRGFLGHEMAHLVSDNAAQGCNDYIVRDAHVEAGADALAARVLGTQPVKAFLERVIAITEGQNLDAKSRLKLLQ